MHLHVPWLSDGTKTDFRVTENSWQERRFSLLPLALFSSPKPSSRSLSVRPSSAYVSQSLFAFSTGERWQRPRNPPLEQLIDLSTSTADLHRRPLLFLSMTAATFFANELFFPIFPQGSSTAFVFGFIVAYDCFLFFLIVHCFRFFR